MIKNNKTKIITIILKIYTYQTKNYYVKLQSIIEMKKWYIVIIFTKIVKFPKNLRSKWRGDCALAVMISNDVK